ncbi:MAG: hypothetical protein ACJAQV_000445 [Loktanella salsilacus]|jgi:hypothetical protein
MTVVVSNNVFNVNVMIFPPRNASSSLQRQASPTLAAKESTKRFTLQPVAKDVRYL